MASVTNDIESVLPKTDVCYMLRLQAERGAGSFLPSVREYTAVFGLTQRRADLLPEDAVVMHPGPMIRGLEIADEVADFPRSVITRQVTNGIAVRMAVLYLLLGTGELLSEGLAEGSGVSPVVSLRASPEEVRPVAERRPKTVVIRGGTLVDETGERRGDVVIEDGRIVATETGAGGASVPRGSVVLDAGGCIVAPGLVDLHTHAREPGAEESETVHSASRAAALGGFTAFVAMPNTDPAIDSAAWRARSSISGPGRCARYVSQERSRSAGRESTWHRWRSSRLSGSGCSPMTGTGSRTPE